MHPLQSKEWEQARKQMGIAALRLEDYLVTFHKIPFTNYKIGYLPRSVMPSKKVLNELYNYGKKNGVIFIKIEPYSPRVIPSEDPPAGGDESRDLKKRFLDFARNDKLIKSPHPLFPAWTQVLDLNKTEDELLKSFHSKTRYNIRLAEKKGVVVKEMSNDKGFEIFSQLYFETCKRQKYFGHTPKYHQIVWNNLKNNISHILIAYYNNISLAAYELWYLDGIIYYVYGGTSEEYRNFMASNLLMWESIKLGKRLGAKKFDMWGSLPPNYAPTHPWSGFTRFKQGYGGQFVEFVGSYDLVINPFLYKIYNVIYSFRDIYFNFRR